MFPKQSFVTNDNGVIVERYQVCSTRIFVYVAMVPFDGSATNCEFSSINYTQHGKPVGYIPTRRPNAEIMAMPRGGGRIDAVHAWYAAQAEIAYAEIIKAFPEAAQGTKDNGQIEICIPE